MYYSFPVFNECVRFFEIEAQSQMWLCGYRGDFAIDMGRNIIHGSDSVDSAQKEIALWFKPSELAQYTLATEKWNYE